MRLASFVSLSLAIGASALDEVSLAKNRIDDLQKKYSINWEDRPSIDGRTLDKNTEPEVVVYIERHIDKSYINTGVSDDSFSLTKSTTVIKDITEGSAVSAQSSTGFQLSAPISFSISKGNSRTDQKTKSNGLYTSDIRMRQETCKAGHACRFESWTYFVQIKGKCRGSPCEIRAPITGPDGKAMTAVIYIPQKMPTGISAIEESLKAELERDYCIDWSNPPTRNRFQQQLTWSSSVSRPPVRLLNKPHNVTVYVKRVAEPGQASTDDSDGSLFAERSTTTIDSSTEGWSVGAQTSYQFGLSLQLPSPSSFGAAGSVQFSKSKSEDKSRQETDGKWTSDGFSIRSTCKSGHYCTFETWTFYAHISGICQNTEDLPLQRHCELHVPIFNRAGEPLTQFVSVSENIPSGNRDDKKQSNSENGTPKDRKDKAEPSSADKKTPKALGAIGHLCMLDNYEYWGIEAKKYLDYEKDNWAKDSNRPEPENLENCNEPLPKEPLEAGNKCYKNELRAASLPEPKQDVPEEKTQESSQDNKQKVPTKEEKKAPQVTEDESSGNSYPPESETWIDAETGEYLSPGSIDGIDKTGAPKPEGDNQCTGTGASAQAAKATGEVKRDRAGRSWCVLSDTEWYDKFKDEYFYDDDDIGVPRSGKPKPQDLDKCKIPEKQDIEEKGEGCQTAASVKVTFRLPEQTSFGQTIKIVGNTDVLGNWDTSRAVDLDASEYQHPNKPMWKGDVTLQAGQRIEYKYIKVEQNGGVQWEADPNHTYEVPRTCAPTAEQVDKWQK